MVCSAAWVGPSKLWLSFTGEASNWPSKSNDNLLAWRKGKPIITHTRDFARRMAVIKSEYRVACASLPGVPGYGDCKILARCLLGSRSRMFDSHNFCKTFGDWAEEVGLTSNDKHMTIWAAHKRDVAIATPDAAATDIIIMPIQDFNFSYVLGDFDHEQQHYFA